MPEDQQAIADGHDWRCDYVRYPDDPDKECYCPTPAEAAEQHRYDEAVASGEPPEPYWAMPRPANLASRLPADEHHYDVSCDDRPGCTIPQHHALEDMA